VGVGVGAASCRYEITSWKLEDAPEYDGAVGVRTDLAGAHVVFVVDNSGSMRKDDVVGYKSRTDAVYDCLLREFVDPQVSTDRGSPTHIQHLPIKGVVGAHDTERVELVGSHGRWTRPCLQTTHMTI
jgi:hypothetical protein